MKHFDETLGGDERDRKVPQGDKGEAVFLDPWLTPKGDSLASLVEDLMDITRPDLSARARLPRQDALHRKRFCLGNIAANLAMLALSPDHEPGNLLAVATAKTKPSRYGRGDYPRGILAKTLGDLGTDGLLIRHPYVFKQRATTVEPTPGFLTLLQSHGVRLADIGRDTGGESIWLNARTGEVPFGNQPSPKCLVPYADTEETIRLRAEMDRVSAFLNQSEIAYAGEQTGPVAMRRMFLLRSPSDQVAFTLNGRLAGGFWMDLKSDKRHLITIGGEDIADLDFASMFAMLAYLRVTGNLPGGDPYEVPGLEEHRAGAKLGLLSLLSRSNDMRRLSPELKAELPDGWTAGRLADAMVRRHPAIAHLFGSDIGVELMNTESNLLMAVLQALEAKGTAALPIHDGLMVGASGVKTVLEVMKEVSEQKIGVALQVREKAIWRPEGRVAAAA